MLYQNFSRQSHFKNGYVDLNILTRHPKNSSNYDDSFGGRLLHWLTRSFPFHSASSATPGRRFWTNEKRNIFSKPESQWKEFTHVGLPHVSDQALFPKKFMCYVHAPCVSVYQPPLPNVCPSSNLGQFVQHVMHLIMMHLNFVFWTLRFTFIPF